MGTLLFMKGASILLVFQKHSLQQLMTYNLETRKIKTIFVNHEKHYFMNIMKTNDKLFVNISDMMVIHCILLNNKIHTIIPTQILL